jgi:hypothetical protein
LAYKLTGTQTFVAGMILLISQIHKVASPYQLLQEAALCLVLLLGLREFLSSNLLAVQIM